MNGILQLAKGIAIGLVLLLAIIGLIDLFQDKSADQVQRSSTETEIRQSTQESVGQITSTPQNSVKTPDFSISRPEPAAPEASSTASAQERLIEPLDQRDNSTSQPQDTTSATPTDESISSDEQGDTLSQPAVDGFKPEIVEEEVALGEISLSATYIGSSDPSPSDFSVFDTNQRKVAERKAVAVTTIRLPEGNYTVVADHNGKSQKQAITVSKNELSARRFQFSPAVTTGIVQVTALSSPDEKPVKTRFTVYRDDGELVASREQVSSTFFKLEAGKYKVTAGEGEAATSKTIRLGAGDSINQTFRIQPVIQSGMLLVSAVEEQSGRPLSVDFVISTPDGRVVTDRKSTTRADFKLPPGDYRIRVTGPNGQSTRNITLRTNQQLAELFQFRSLEETSTPVTTESPTPVVSKSQTVVDSGAHTEVDSQADQQVPGRLMLSAIDATSRKSLKSNFYIQRPNGTHVDKKIYADAAEFSLPPGEYKITVKSTGMLPVTRRLNLRDGDRLNQMFTLQPQNSVQTKPAINQEPAQVAQDTPFTDSTAKPPAFGELIVSMQNGDQKNSRNALLTTFLIDTAKGKRIAAIESVQNATVRLDVGDYIVTAIHKGSKQIQRITIRNNRVTRLDFNSRDFQRPEGVLISRVIDPSGRPLKGDISVINRRGKVIRRAQNVSRAEFRLPPREFTVRLEFEGLTGNESVRIYPDETTMQTFTVARDQAPPAEQRPRDTNDRIRDKIREELRRIIR